MNGFTEHIKCITVSINASAKDATNITLYSLFSGKSTLCFEKYIMFSINKNINDTNGNSNSKDI